MLQQSREAINYERYSWRPRAAMLDGHLGLLMPPAETEFVVPDPIKWRECQSLNRCWLMTRKSNTSGMHWTLLGATHLYAGKDIVECSEAQPP